MIDTELDYAERIRLLRERKFAQTQEKVEREGGLDEDDYGRIVPPADFKWQRIPNHSNGSFYRYRGWAENFYDLMSRHPVYVDPLDAFAGKWMFFMSRIKGPTWNPDYDYSHLKPGIAKYGIIPGIGSDAHFAPDYHIGLELGWGGLLEKIRHYRSINGPECGEMYDAEEKTIQAIQLWITRTCDHIAAMIPQQNNTLCKDNLIEMERVNRKVISEPPETLREVCQWLCWFNMASRTYNRDGAGGQLDELLRPYYEKDIRAGIIDDEDAKFYIACLLLNDPHYYQLCGPDADGKDMTSHVSHLILESAKMINSSCNLTIRVHDGLDEEIFLKSVRYLFENGNAWPRYSGDKSLVEGFMRCGYSAELARKRIAVGCNWMSLPGLEYTLNDLVKINTAKIFEVAWNEMIGDGERSTTRLWELFIKHLGKAVDVTGQCMDFHLRYQVYNEPELVLNLLSHGPIEKGLDVSCGGAEYYNLAIDGAGIATVADSFAALQTHIEEGKRTTWDAIGAALADNFSGVAGERLRLMLSSTPRYGGGETVAEDWAKRISSKFTAMVRELNTVYPGRNFIPGWFSWANTLEFGHAVKATPNGRRDGEVINHGANP